MSRQQLLRTAEPAAPLLGLVLVQQILYRVPSGVVLDGALYGSRVGLIAIGIVLVYRANRIVNFAQGDLGAVPAALGVLLVEVWAWSYWLGLLAGLAAAVVLGMAIQALVMRRFSESPRLIVTVATIGVAQLLTAAALWLPRPFGLQELDSPELPAPFAASFEVGGVIFDAHDIMTLALVPLTLLGLWMLLNRSLVGTAILGAAERPNRAATLGIPVQRLHTVVWVLASVLAFVAMYLRAGVVGPPIGQVLSPVFLVQALAAAVFGRFRSFTTVVTAAIGFGVLDQAITYTGRPEGYNYAVLFVVVLVGLVWTWWGDRGNGSTRVDAEASTWQAVREVRPLPRELARLPEVRFGRAGLWLTVGALLLSLPYWLTASRLVLATTIVILGIVATSLVVLTGWSGQVSLGQMAFVGVGAAVGGVLTHRHGWDLVLAAVAAGAVGAAVAIVVGYPALRRRGLTLAVSTLAFAVFTSEYLLHRSISGDWLPPRPRQLDEPTVLGVIAIGDQRGMFYVAVVALLLAIAMVVGVRRSRTGRVLIAIRENEHAATSYGIDAQRATLAAFALSGFLAAAAGALLVHHMGGLNSPPYTPQRSLDLFSMVVIGGLGSLPGALAGTAYVRGAASFLPGQWQFLATGVGLLAVLMLFPGGLGGVLAGSRERLLRKVAQRRNMIVPALTGAAAPAAGHPGSQTDEPGEIPPRGAGRQEAHEKAAQPALLAARGVEVDYSGVQVLFGVDLHVSPGEIVALLGTNGAGKSTMLRAVSGLVRPSAGEVSFDGRDITRMRPHQVAAVGITQVPGGEGVFTQLSVAGNLRLAGWLRRRQRHERREQDRAAADGGTDRGSPARDATEQVLDMFPVLRERWDEPAGNLSSGQQQMLALGMAFLTRPKLLMIDELSLGLAPAVVDQLLEMVRALRDRGVTVILVEQSVDVALAVADRAYFMEKGEIRFHGPAAELLDRPDLLRSIFLSRGGMQSLPPEPASPPRTASAGSPVLEVRDISKRFGGVSALDEVSFDVRSGEILGLIGPNGAGKTTLFDVISGFLQADAGAFHLRTDRGTVDLSRVPAPRRAWYGLARSFQDGRLFGSLTVSETIAVALERHVEVRDPLAASLHLPAVAGSERAVSRRVDELIELLGLQAYRDSFGHELSTGTRRIVDLACVLAQAPQVVLLDEPSSGIAQREAEALGPVLQQVRSELGASLLVIEHDLPLLLGIADRLVALDLGRVIAQGEPRIVMESPRVTTAYLGGTAASASS